jgi:hypothetical protein
MNATSSTSLDPAAQPVALPIPGSGTSAGTGAAGRALPGVASPVRAGDAVPLDAFAKRAGPDVAVSTVEGMVRVHAVFQLDPMTKEMTVSVVDEAGKLVRLIPPDSVAKMIAAMAAYRGR